MEAKPCPDPSSAHSPYPADRVDLSMEDEELLKSLGVWSRKHAIKSDPLMIHHIPTMARGKSMVGIFSRGEFLSDPGAIFESKRATAPCLDLNEEATNPFDIGT